MIKFLLTRPVAVTMSFIAVLFLGMVSLQRLPVSLMPDIAIPEITVQLSSPNTSARELENSVVQHLRRQLMQVNHLEDIQSETIDGLATIRLNLEYGTDINYAFIEVNEKIDMAMNYMPRHVQRPRVMKAGVGDIPVLWLNLSQKKKALHAPESDTTAQANSLDNAQGIGKANTGQAFSNLSRFAANVISKRLEQLPEVAMVDMSGMAKSGIRVVPDMKKLDAMGLQPESLEQLIKINNNRLGSLSVKDGQYLYNIRFSSELLDKRDIEDIYFNHDGRVFQLKDIALVEEFALPMKGMVLANGDAVVSMAVIKQSDAQINKMKKSLERLIDHFKRDYPDIEFEVTRDQTLLLEYSINNLKQNLLFGSLLAFIVMFFFLRDFKSPFLIGIVIPLSLLVSLLFFHVLKLSINIISLSGLVLGVGMMIDNSIIVIDNITQHWERNSRFKISNLKFETSNLKSETSNLKSETSNQESLLEACESGTNEIIRPLLSSVLTTCAVFIPLIFLKGISGALFYDQAMAVSIGLFSSLAVSISVLPVYYLIFYKKGSGFGKSKLLKKFNAIDYAELYEKGFRLVMRNPLRTSLGFVLMLVFAAIIYTDLPRTKMPVFEKDELLLSIDWNEAMHPEANRDLTLALVSSVTDKIENYTAMIGEQQFLLDKAADMGPSGALVYFKLKEGFLLDDFQQNIEEFFRAGYPDAIFGFSDAGNIFNVIFPDKEVELMARLRPTDGAGRDYHGRLVRMVRKIADGLGFDVPAVAGSESVVLRASAQKMALYEVNYNALYNEISRICSGNEIFLIVDNNDFIPVIMGSGRLSIDRAIAEAHVANKRNVPVPMRELLEFASDVDLKSIVAGREGEFYPLVLPSQNINATMNNVRQSVAADKGFEVSFSGSYFSNKLMVRQMLIVLLISLALLYFILASQFESLTLPIIVLLEVPIDLFGAFLFLWIWGGGINLMSLIGIIVMSGIIINDSILKIDTINQLRRQGYGLLRALSEAGKRRLKPILMTSITTILALMPFLFTGGLGSDLQRPLALAVIGGMVVGTVVSLYFIPLCYYVLERKAGNSKKKLVRNN